MASYSELTAALLREAKVREDALPLRNEECRSQFLFQSHKPKKVCLFFHGFTAGSYQFKPMAEVLFRSGYNVVIPRLPGHGQAGAWWRDNPPPLPTQPQDYQRFASAWLRQAQALGDRVIVGGLSGGGTLAAWLMLEYPQQIDRTLLFAPYLSSSSKIVDLFVRHVGSYVEWVSSEPRQTPIAYEGFAMPALRVFLEMGEAVLKRARHSPLTPLFIVSSESDIAVDNADHRALFETALKTQPKCWYQRFDRILEIPHTMMTAKEGNRYQNLLIALAKAYIESDLTWAEVQEIGYRMTQGRTFSKAIAELDLEQRASRDLPTLITMLDKRSIALSRSQPGGKRVLNFDQ
jgi:esterase/lipase